MDQLLALGSQTQAPPAQLLTSLVDADDGSLAPAAHSAAVDEAEGGGDSSGPAGAANGGARKEPALARGRAGL